MKQMTLQLLAEPNINKPISIKKRQEHGPRPKTAKQPSSPVSDYFFEAQILVDTLSL
jgi:hypothetical protein